MFRLGRPSDLEAVSRLTKVANIYEGWDYLVGNWLEWVQDPNRVMAVAEKDGQIVGVLHICQYTTKILCVNLCRHGFGLVSKARFVLMTRQLV